MKELKHKSTCTRTRKGKGDEGGYHHAHAGSLHALLQPLASACVNHPVKEANIPARACYQKIYLKDLHKTATCRGRWTKLQNTRIKCSAGRINTFDPKCYHSVSMPTKYYKPSSTIWCFTAFFFFR